MGQPRREVLLNKLHDFATKYKGDPQAAEALMSFFRGECEHICDCKGRCELCGAYQPTRTRN